MIYSKKKRCQASFEYLAVFSIGLLLLLPMVYMFQRYSAQSVETIQQNKIATIGQDIVNTAETVYYMGLPARLTIQEDFPTGITNLSLLSNWSQNVNILTFTFSGGKNLSYFCGVNLNASFNQSSYSAGIKNILLEMRNTTKAKYVQIRIN